MGRTITSFRLGTKVANRKCLRTGNEKGVDPLVPIITANLLVMFWRRGLWYLL